jgi:nucleotide-binding universal stress UspA family protein
MTPDGKQPPIRRILIALDASPPSIAALEAAATRAARINAELLGVFIEDINLLRLASLPFAAEIGVLSPRARPLATEEMERHLRAQRARAEEVLERVAERLQLRWSFRVARGQIVAELLAAALEADLMALGAMSTQMIRRSWLGSTTQAIMARTARPLLITPHGATVRSPIAVVYDGSSGSVHALALARYVCEQLSDGALVVLLIADDAEQEERLRHAAMKQLGSSRASARYRWLVESDANELARALRTEHVGTLVFAADVRELDAQSVRQLLERMDVALLSVGAVGEVSTSALADAEESGNE